MAHNKGLQDFTRSPGRTSEGKENESVLAPGQFGHYRARYHRDGAPRPALGTINVIFAKASGDAGTCSGVMSMVRVPAWKIGARLAKRPNWWPCPL